MSTKRDLTAASGLPTTTIDPAVPRPAPANVRRPIVAGLAVLAVAFGGFGTWAATAPLDSAVIAPGVLAVESKRKTVQHLEGGIVKEILVEEGERVEKGAVLVRLDGTQAAAAQAAAEARLAAARAREARLLAERDGKTAVALPADLRRSTDPRVREAIADERRQFEERRRGLDGQVAILEQRIQQLQAEIDGHEAQRSSRQRQADSLRGEIAGLRKLLKDGFVPRNRILALERELAALEGDQGFEAAGVARSRENIAEARLEMIQTRQRFQEQVVAELNETRERIDALRTEATAASDIARRLDITAPVGGVVQELRVFTEGGVIPTGGQLMDIVPDDENLVVESRVAPSDVAAVMVGQSAEVRFPALERARTPRIDGLVAVISPDRLTDPRTHQPYYLARVEIPAEERAKLGEQRLQAGMPAEVIIRLGERTAMDYLVKPIQDSFSRALTER